MSGRKLKRSLVPDCVASTPAQQTGFCLRSSKFVARPPEDDDLPLDELSRDLPDAPEQSTCTPRACEPLCRIRTLCVKAGTTTLSCEADDDEDERALRCASPISVAVLEDHVQVTFEADASTCIGRKGESITTTQALSVQYDDVLSVDYAPWGRGAVVILRLRSPPPQAAALGVAFDLHARGGDSISFFVAGEEELEAMQEALERAAVECTKEAYLSWAIDTPRGAGVPRRSPRTEALALAHWGEPGAARARRSSEDESESSCQSAAEGEEGPRGPGAWDERVVATGDVLLRRSDLDACTALTPRAADVWLSRMRELLQSARPATPSLAGRREARIAITPSSFYRKLCLRLRAPDAAQVPLPPDFGLRHSDFALVPICERNRWSLAVVCNCRALGAPRAQPSTGRTHIVHVGQAGLASLRAPALLRRYLELLQGAPPPPPPSPPRCFALSPAREQTDLRTPATSPGPASRPDATSARATAAARRPTRPASRGSRPPPAPPTPLRRQSSSSSLSSAEETPRPARGAAAGPWQISVRDVETPEGLAPGDLPLLVLRLVHRLCERPAAFDYELAPTLERMLAGPDFTREALHAFRGELQAAVALAACPGSSPARLTPAAPLGPSPFPFLAL